MMELDESPELNKLQNQIDNLSSIWMSVFDRNHIKQFKYLNVFELKLKLFISFKKNIF